MNHQRFEDSGHDPYNKPSPERRQPVILCPWERVERVTAEQLRTADAIISRTGAHLTLKEST